MKPPASESKGLPQNGDEKRNYEAKPSAVHSSAHRWATKPYSKEISIMAKPSKKRPKKPRKSKPAKRTASKRIASKRTAPTSAKPAPFKHDRRVPPVGTVLAKDWTHKKGKPDKVRVRVETDGFTVIEAPAKAKRHRGQKFPTLSSLATAVTGNRRNGFEWFELPLKPARAA